MPTYPHYDVSSASRVFRWRARGRYHVAAVWDPPAGFTGPRGVAIRKHGGKRHNPRDLSLSSTVGTNPTAEMFTDVLGAYVVAYDTDPGGLWRAEGEEIDLELADEALASDALFVMFLRAHCADPAVVGSTRTIDPNPARWAAFGESSGAWDVARSQLVPLGGFGDLAARESIRGGRRYRFDPDHRVGHLFLFIGQNRLSTFNAYETRAKLAATATGSSSGSSSLAVSSGAPPMRAGGSIGYDLTGEGDRVPARVTYGELASDYAGGAGSISLVDPLVEDVPNGTPLWYLPAATSYVAETGGGSNLAGASTLRIVGDAVALRTANRLRVDTSVPATATGSSSGASTLAVSSGFPALRTGTYIGYDLGSGIVWKNVVADYAGGAGSVSIETALGANVPNGTPLFVRFDLAVTAPAAAPASFATPIDVSVWPSLAVDVADGATVALLHFNYEDYGPAGWAPAYLFSGSSGYTWATFPFEEKREADVDLLLEGANPRAAELNVLVAGPVGNTLWRIDSLTDPRSWNVRHAGAPAVLPERMDLHDPGDMALLAHKLHLAGARVAGYLGGREDNPGQTSPSIPWLQGRNAAFDSSVLAAFLTDPDAIGGAYS